MRKLSARPSNRGRAKLCYPSSQERDLGPPALSRRGFEMTDEVRAAIVGAATGAVFGALASLLVNFLSTRFRIERYHCTTKLERQPRFGARITARVINGYDYPMNDAIAYITVHHQESDVLPPPNGYDAFIKPPNDVKCVNEERLCWSINGNPYRTDIYGGERQSLDVFEVNDSWIEIPSESGWGAIRYEGGRLGKARALPPS